MCVLMVGYDSLLEVYHPLVFGDLDWLLQVYRFALESFCLAENVKPPEKSHKFVGIFFFPHHLELHLMTLVSLYGSLFTFIAEEVKVSIWANRSTKEYLAQLSGLQKASWRPCVFFLCMRMFPLPEER